MQQVIGMSPQRLRVMQAIHQLTVLVGAAIAVRVAVIGTFLYGQVLPEPHYAIVLDLLFGTSIACALWGLRPSTSFLTGPRWRNQSLSSGAPFFPPRPYAWLPPSGQAPCSGIGMPCPISASG